MAGEQKKGGGRRGRERGDREREKEGGQTDIILLSRKTKTGPCELIEEFSLRGKVAHGCVSVAL